MERNDCIASPDENRLAPPLGRPAAAPPRAMARVAGLLYLGTIVAGLFAELVVRSSLIVSHDAAVTARNLIAREDLYRQGVVADLIMLACYVGVTALFYDLFRPVSRRLSLLAACFSMTGIAVLAADGLCALAPLRLLGAPSSSTGLSEGLRQGIAYSWLSLHSDGYDLSLVFFGIYCVLIGWLVFQSKFLPRIVGVLMVLAGLAYLFNSLADLGLPILRRLSRRTSMTPNFSVKRRLRSGSWLSAVSR